ncbi:MAG TPA: pyridoxamine 5'-phosphate oxidase family protein, partial [Acidobacteriaceae bacterium]|nr:pyridoxamine 5'-phosphate oxidase family protein [Acidobacteriaceae bacterium]
MDKNANSRESSRQDPFSPEAIDPTDPLPCFHAWFAEARALEPNDPDAMALATATPQGVPSVRMVLLKEVTADASFVFYTNAQSRKGL